MTSESLRRGLLRRMGWLLLWFALVEAVVLYHVTRAYSNEVYDQWLLDSAHAVAQLVRVTDDRVTVDLPETTLQAMLWDARDRILFRVDGRTEGLLAGQPELKVRHDWGRRQVHYIDLALNGVPMRAVQIERDDVEPGHPVLITVAETLHKRQRLAQRVLTTAMGVTLLVGLLMVLFARGAITRGLRPLVQLTEVIHQRRSGDLTRLPDVPQARELRTFTEAINGLLAQLDEAVQLQRRFVADAAHQLRTPLAALKVELEHAFREPDPVRHQQALTELRGGIDRLARLTNQLLTLARAEPGALSPIGFREVDLVALAQQTACRFLPRSLAQGADLGFEQGGAAHVQGDPLLLEELINNLLDNALHYAGPRAQITVRVEASEAQAVLTVEDNGPGVPAEELARLTTRFHRPAGSPAGGSGLGLAIVDEITQRHGGHLSLEPVAPHGLRVRVCLPTSPPTPASGE